MLTEALYSNDVSGPICNIPAIANADTEIETAVTSKPILLRFKYKYPEAKNKIASESETKPCLEFDKKMAIIDIITQISAVNLKARGIRFINKVARESVVSTAINAEAKFGFPTVPIIALYGLLQLTKSRPEICIRP